MKSTSLRNKRWKVLSSRIAYKGKYIKIREKNIVKPNGERGIYSYLEVPRTVGIVAIDSQNNVYLCKQYRYIFNDEPLEIPRGLVDPGETSKQAAIRELKEETDIDATNIQYIGGLRTSVGFLDEETQIFLVKGFTVPNNIDKTDEIDKVIKLPFDKALSLIRKNKIVDGLTVSALLKANQLI